MDRNIGERVRQLRITQRLEQKDLAGILAVGKTSISHKECGRTQFSADELGKLAKTFNVSIDYLITGHEASKDQTITEREQRLIKTFRRLPPQAQTDLIEMALDRLLASSLTEN